jgi:thioredoxin-like negative regulator of GroEL
LTYQRARKLLEDHHDRIARIDKPGLDQLLQLLAFRLAIIDAIEHRLADARTRLGSDAPANDAELLKRLAEIAHDQLDNDAIARPLLEQAHQLVPQQTDVLSDLAEVYFATANYSNLASVLTQLARLQTTLDQRVVLATVDWAAARLTRSPDGPQRQRVAQAYQALADGTEIQWTWAGTKHALLYGHLRHEDARLIVGVLELLKQPVSAENRAKLVELLQATNQPSR